MTEATMQKKERSEATGRAQRALKALGEHPCSSKKELSHAREHLNACYSHGSGEYVWNAVAQVEAMAERRYGVLSRQEHRQLADAAGDLEEPATAGTAAASRRGDGGQEYRRMMDVRERSGGLDRHDYLLSAEELQVRDTRVHPSRRVEG